MQLYPNAKINIGLRIVERRTDGYHNLHSLMLPISWHDCLSVDPAVGEGSFIVSAYGGAPRRIFADEAEANLVIKAQRALERHIGRAFEPLDIVLEKHIPMGAGLGGGSADASAMIIALNQMFELGMDKDELARVAARVGADCPFFIYNRPMLVGGTGDILMPVDVGALGGVTCLTVMPMGEAVSTKEAYGGVKPKALAEGENLKTILDYKPTEWGGADCLLPVNDFEASVLPAHPGIALLRSEMSEQGAVYVSMSGSGAAVFGLFDDEVKARAAYDTFKDRLPANLTVL